MFVSVAILMALSIVGLFRIRLHVFVTYLKCKTMLHRLRPDRQYFAVAIDVS